MLSRRRALQFAGLLGLGSAVRVTAVAIKKPELLTIGLAFTDHGGGIEPVLVLVEHLEKLGFTVNDQFVLEWQGYDCTFVMEKLTGTEHELRKLIREKWIAQQAKEQAQQDKEEAESEFEILYENDAAICYESQELIDQFFAEKSKPWDESFEHTVAVS